VRIAGQVDPPNGAHMSRGRGWFVGIATDAGAVVIHVSGEGVIALLCGSLPILGHVPRYCLRDFRASIVPPFGQKSCSNLGTEPHLGLVLATSALFSTSRESVRRPGAEFGRYRN